MKTLIIISYFLFGQYKTFGQIPNIIHNYTSQDSTQNPLIDSFSKKYDFIIAYTEQSYWWANRKNYKILAFSNNKWSSWTYSNYFVQGTKKNGIEKITVDTIKIGHYFLENTVLKYSSVSELLTNLESNNFWTLNNDSLNQSRLFPIKIKNGDTTFRIASISDGINYRFDIISKSRLRVIESYEPDYFLELFTDMFERRKFILNRDIFLSWWKKYSR